jgi:DNA-directed RNA polymerase III subunit RPC1
MFGREGLVDTAVKTAETGYMSRRLMKSLEDLSAQYDNTVRNSSGGIVQFQFGGDKLDPVDMEGSAPTSSNVAQLRIRSVPVNFDRTFTHATSITWDNNHRALLPYEITAMCEDLLAKEKAKLTRRGLKNDEHLKYEDQSDYAINEHETARNFLDTVSEYVTSLASRLAKARQKAGLQELEDDPKLSGGFYDPAEEDKARADHVERVARVSEAGLKRFIELYLTKYARAHVEPCHVVGAIGAQSIGEPGTQMTLRTFHFAGVAGRSTTQGVRRIKEIINASKAISTPIITCPLQNPGGIVAARVVKRRIEKTYVSDVIHFIEDLWSATGTTICISVDTQARARCI